MPFLPTLRAAVALLLALCLVCPPARALVTFNDGREHIYVTGSAGIGYDSNLFAHNQGGGDTLYTASVLAEYTRRAGWIGVNASVGLNLSQFVDHTDQNSTDPRLALEFVKGGGRTTGGLSLSAVREHRADSAANLRAESWNYNGTLTVKYPVMERYSVAGTAGYSEQVYDAKYNLSNLQTTSIGADLLYDLFVFCILTLVNEFIQFFRIKLTCNRIRECARDVRHQRESVFTIEVVVKLYIVYFES